MRRKVKRIRKKRIFPGLPQASGLEGVQQLEAKYQPRRWRRQNLRFTVDRCCLIKPNKYTQNSNRRIKMLVSDKRPFIVFDGNTDHTPKGFMEPGDRYYVDNSDIWKFDKQLQLNTLQLSPGDLSPDSKPDEMAQNRAFQDVFADKMSINKRTSIGVDGKPLAIREAFASDTIILKHKVEPVPSIPMFHVDVLKPETPVVDRRRIVINLAETKTITLFDLVATVGQKGEPEGDRIEARNAIALAEKSRLKRLSNSFTQTRDVNIIKQNHGTLLSRVLREDKASFAAPWDSDYLYKKIERHLDKSTKSGPLQRIGKVDAVIVKPPPTEIQPIMMPSLYIKNSKKFFTRAMVIERILVSNNARKRQILYKDLMKSDPYSNDVEFNYRLHLLWTFKTDLTKGKSVNSVAWNTRKKDLVAIGYGRFNYADRNGGLVCVWNIKNLCYPERTYPFDQPVNCVAFSRRSPRVLAVGFHSGLVLLIDISKRYLTVLHKNMSAKNTNLYPLWKVLWIEDDLNREVVVECLGNGQVNKYCAHYHLLSKRCMQRITMIKSVPDGIDYQKPCMANVVPRSKFSGIRCVAFHPTQKGVYLIGSEEGGVYKCSTDDIHHYQSVFVAHNGPVYVIEFNPATAKVFLTCGADWCIRIWAENIYKPLVTLISSLTGIFAASWYPVNSTVIANLNDNAIELWDISRKLTKPKSVTKSPSGAPFASLTFSACGSNLCAGDTRGNVFVFAFKDMPFPPIHAEFILGISLLKALTTQPALKAEALKLGVPFKLPRRTKPLASTTKKSSIILKPSDTK